jgi:hypothetical protein
MHWAGQPSVGETTVVRVDTSGTISGNAPTNRATQLSHKMGRQRLPNAMSKHAIAALVLLCALHTNTHALHDQILNKSWTTPEQLLNKSWQLLINSWTMPAQILSAPWDPKKQSKNNV